MAPLPSFYYRGPLFFLEVSVQNIRGNTGENARICHSAFDTMVETNSSGVLIESTWIAQRGSKSEIRTFTNVAIDREKR